MTTVYADAITAVSTNGDLSLQAGQAGGAVSIASTLKMKKGGDISSASPLVIDTDGNYFDVTGTTNFSAMTVEEGNFFMLQFDGALTITHGSGIELPEATNLTTAAGDRLICYATAADTVVVMSRELETIAKHTLTQATEQATTSGSSVTFSSIPAGTKQIYGMLMGVSSDANHDIMVQLGDSGGIETSGYLGSCSNIAAAVAANQQATDAFDINKFNAGDICHGTFILTLADASNVWTYTSVIGQSAGISALSYMGGGQKPLSGELTQVHVKIASGAFNAGSINIMYSQ